MVYVFSTCKCYFFFFLARCIANLHVTLNCKIYHANDADLHFVLYVLLYVRELHPKWSWGFSVNLKLIVLSQSCHMLCCIILVSMVPELHDMCIVRLLKAVTPAWVTNTVPFLLVVNYNHYSNSFEILKVQVESHVSVEPARPVPRVLNKHYSARA